MAAIGYHTAGLKGHLRIRSAVSFPVMSPPLPEHTFAVRCRICVPHCPVEPLLSFGNRHIGVILITSLMKELQRLKSIEPMEKPL